MAIAVSVLVSIGVALIFGTIIWVAWGTVQEHMRQKNGGTKLIMPDRVEHGYRDNDG